MIYGFGYEKHSGKSTAARIWQALNIWNNELIDSNILDEYEDDSEFVKYVLKNQHIAKYSDFEYKLFAEKLKQITCLLIGCSMDDLENTEFKETELGEKWWKYEVSRYYLGKKIIVTYHDFAYIQSNPNTKEIIELQGNYLKLIKLTPRLLMQLLGTDFGRNMVHPNLWVNSLMSDYACCDKNWLVSDVRFPNEIEAIKERGGKIIKIERFSPNDKKELHESETALNNYNDWDYVVKNFGTIDDLIVRIKEIMIREKVINYENNTNKTWRIRNK